MGSIPVSGRNGEAIVGSSSDIRHILETNSGGARDFDGDQHTFELLHLQAYNSHASSQGVLVLFDSNESTAAPSSTRVVGPLPVPALSLVDLEWERGSGPKFRVNITAETQAGAGTFAIGSIFASGLLH